MYFPTKLGRKLRALIARANEIIGQSQRMRLPFTTGILHTPSHLDIRIDPSTAPIDPAKYESIIEMVKKKDLTSLNEFGGVESVARDLHSDTKIGIRGDPADIHWRTNAFGSNLLSHKLSEKKGICHFVLKALMDITILMILAFASLSLGFGIKKHGVKEGWHNGGSLFVAAVLVLTVSASNNLIRSILFNTLSTVCTNIDNIQVINVVRDGKPHDISISNILVGDIVSLRIGDLIPADGLFIGGRWFQVNEISMPGEMDGVNIDKHNPFLFYGYKVVDGYSVMLVTTVGTKTACSEIMSTFRRDNINDRTPLQAKLDKLTSYNGKIGLAVAVATVIMLCARYFTGNTKDENGNREFNGRKTNFKGAMYVILHSVAAAVTVPEILPFAATLTLAYSMKRMIADKIMIRKVSACETMALATTICINDTDILKDQSRPRMRAAVDACKDAGLSIKMITEDHVSKAVTIADECGILEPKQELNRGAVVEGFEFRKYTPEERMQKVEKICVVAGSSPHDKLLMVECLKLKGHVVAVMGKRIKDVPALKKADIGLSMGIQNAGVIKENSDMVILDDSFASVAQALQWARCVYNNIQRFIQFQLTMIAADHIINFIAAVSAVDVPLTVVQLLWMYLIMYLLVTLAVITENPTKELMEKPPVGRAEPLLNNVVWRNLIAQSLYQMAVRLTLQLKGEAIFGVNEKVRNALIFNTFVLCQIFNVFNARKLEKKNVFKGIQKNKSFMGIVGITIFLQVVMMEFLKRFGDTESLNWKQWGACMGIAVISWPIAWAAKCSPVLIAHSTSIVCHKKFHLYLLCFLAFLHFLKYNLSHMDRN